MGWSGVECNICFCLFLSSFPSFLPSCIFSFACKQLLCSHPCLCCTELCRRFIYVAVLAALFAAIIYRYTTLLLFTKALYVLEDFALNNHLPFENGTWINETVRRQREGVRSPPPFSFSFSFSLLFLIDGCFAEHVLDRNGTSPPRAPSR